jgi:hypothetical protein
MNIQQPPVQQPPVQQPPPQPQQGTFALTPVRVTNAVLDYNNNVATKIYKGAIQALAPEFDVDAEGLNMFTAALYSKSREYGWDHILEVPRDLQAPTMDLVNVITNYGELTLEHLRAFAATYVATPTRVAQDSIMLYECIWNTLSKNGRSKVWIWKDEFHIHSIPTGIVLLKSMMESWATLVSVATYVAANARRCSRVCSP